MINNASNDNVNDMIFNEVMKEIFSNYWKMYSD